RSYRGAWDTRTLGGSRVFRGRGLRAFPVGSALAKESPLRPCEVSRAGLDPLLQSNMVADFRRKRSPRPMDRMARKYQVALAAAWGRWSVRPALAQGGGPVPEVAQTPQSEGIVVPRARPFGPWPPAPKVPGVPPAAPTPAPAPGPAAPRPEAPPAAAA